MAKLDSIYASIFPKVSGILDFELMRTLPLRDEWDSTMEYLTMFGDHMKSRKERCILAQKIIHHGLYPGIKLSLDGYGGLKTILWTPPGFSESEVVMSIIRFDGVAEFVTSGITPSRFAESGAAAQTWVVQNEKTLYVTPEYINSFLPNAPFQYVGYETDTPLSVLDPTEKFEFSKTAKMRFPILRKFPDPLYWQAGGTDIPPRYKPKIMTYGDRGFGRILVGETSYSTGTWREKDLLSAVEFLLGRGGGSQKWGLLLRKQIRDTQGGYYFLFSNKRKIDFRNITIEYKDVLY